MSLQAQFFLKLMI